MLGLGAASVVIGLLVGATGIGGFLIIPAFMVLADLPVRTAMGTALLVAAANGALGAYLFLRRGNVDWAVAAPLAAGALVFSLCGGWLNHWLPVPLVVGALGCVMVAGSIASFRNAGMARSAMRGEKPGARTALLASIGCVSGLAAGLTGAGGPLVSVPLMSMLSYPVLTTVGASQVLQLAASLSGSIPYWQTGQVSIAALLLVVPMHLLGIRVGVGIAYKVEPRAATRAVAILGAAAGIGIFILAATNQQSV